MTCAAYHGKMVLLSVLLACSSVVSSIGCGGSQVGPGPSGKTMPGALQLSPAVVNLVQGDSVHFALSTDEIAFNPSNCIWQAVDTIVSSKGNGEFVGTGIGSSSIEATCDGNSASASVLVSPATNPNAIRITSGGTYSGNWSSTDPKVPAVMILTNEPVVVRNSTITSRGNLIVIYGSQGGANVTIDNVTGTALDPGVAGQGRGKFLGAEVMSRLAVTHCTMHGVSFGVYVATSKLTSLTIRDNVADNLDDRKSNGHGGYLLNQRVLGHFIQLNSVSLPNGAEIAWNQMTNSLGAASVEDVISFYQSRGSAEKPIVVHDNYLQGAFAEGQTTWYTGGGIQMDGASEDPMTATGFVQISHNRIVQTANYGISIGAGHDITVTDNRIVSCGKDSTGRWLASQGGSALILWNYYQTSQFYNNSISSNSGGLVRQDANGQPENSEMYVPSVSATLHNVVSNNPFEHPCWVNGLLSQAAEAAERVSWNIQVRESGEMLGDQH